jgi:hypothetical protein
MHINRKYIFKLMYLNEFIVEIVPEIEEDDDDDDEKVKEVSVVNKSHNIARAVVNSIMPWVKVFLLKDEKDHKGGHENSDLKLNECIYVYI